MMQSGNVRSRSASPSTLSRDTTENTEDVDAEAVMLRTKLSHDELAELVLAAAREYFDACATLDDPDLELARRVHCYCVSDNLSFYCVFLFI